MRQCFKQKHHFTNDCRGPETELYTRYGDRGDKTDYMYLIRAWRSAKHARLTVGRVQQTSSRTTLLTGVCYLQLHDAHILPQQGPTPGVNGDFLGSQLQSKSQETRRPKSAQQDVSSNSLFVIKQHSRDQILNGEDKLKSSLDASYILPPEHLHRTIPKTMTVERHNRTMRGPFRDLQTTPTLNKMTK